VRPQGRKGVLLRDPRRVQPQIVGWSIDHAQNTTLVMNALDMAIQNPQPAPGTAAHSDHGVQFISWTRRACSTRISSSPAAHRAQNTLPMSASAMQIRIDTSGSNQELRFMSSL
jgi:transposase InsO family protein